MVCMKLLTKRARRVSTKSRSRRHVDKSADLLSVSNSAQPSPVMGFTRHGDLIAAKQREI